MFLRSLLALLTFNTITVSESIDLANAQTENNDNYSYLSSKRPPPPKRIPPNKVKPGGGLDYGQQACGGEEESLIALIPMDNPVLTTQAHPSFLFYIPDGASAISHGEFDLFTADEKTRVYSTKIVFNQETPGIIKVDLPISAQYALKMAEPYHWYFKIYCNNNVASSSFLDVDGWIKRVPLTPTRASQIEAAAPDIWYDTIALVASNLIAMPNNLEMRNHWLQLLQHINREHLLDVEIQSVPTETSDISIQN